MSDTVDVDPQLFTMIIQFEIDADVGLSFVRELIEAVEKTIIKLPGFRTAVFQISSDRTRVINYAQWESAEIYDQSMSRDDTGGDLVSEVIARSGARVIHADSYSIAATFSSPS